MNGGLRFLSIAAVTQLLLVLNQLLLLPLQLRIWGSEATAHWNVALAAAGLLLIADLGLRTTGHAALLRFIGRPADATARAEFDVSWTGVRVLSALTGIVLLVASVVWWPVGTGGALVPWPTLLVVAVWLEAVMIARIMYLDTVGRYVQAELAYTAMLVCRLAAAVVALVAFDAGPQVLAAIHVCAAAAAMAIQSLSCRDLRCLSLFAPLHFGRRGQLLSLTRYAAAEPLSQWLRVNLPVLVLATMAAPVLVTTYVALRAIFGLVRNLVQQVARFTSVERVLQAGGNTIAETRAAVRRSAVFTAAITVVAAASAIAVIADHLRLVGWLLPGLDRADYSFLCLCFAVPGAFVAYQLVQAQLMRSGRTPAIARRQYLYAVLAGAAAIVGNLQGSPGFYLPLAAGAELCLALFFVSLGDRGDRLRMVVTATSGCIAIAAVTWRVERMDSIFSGISPADWIASAAAWSVVTFVLVVVAARVYRPILDGVGRRVGERVAG